MTLVESTGDADGSPRACRYPVQVIEIFSVLESATVMSRTVRMRLTSLPNVAELQTDCCRKGTDRSNRYKQSRRPAQTSSNL